MVVALTPKEINLFENARYYALENIALHAAEWEKSDRFPAEAADPLQ